METKNQNSMKWYNSVPLAILVAGVMIAASVIYIGGNKTASIGDPNQAANATPTPIKDYGKLVTSGDPMLGDADAEVTIVEFSDFQCPYCRSFFLDTFTQLKEEYIDTGKAKLVFRDFPLPFHAAAKPAAVAALCANEQGKFWEMHDKLFTEQQELEPNKDIVTKTIDFNSDDIRTWALQIGLDKSKFDSCFASSKYDEAIQNDINAGAQYGVDGTPSFFVNGQLLVGAQPYTVFKQVIDEALK